MRALGLRFLRIALLALGAAALFQLLEPYGLGWLLIPGALVFALGWTAVRWVRLRRAGRAARWTDAVLDASARPHAIREIERELKQGEPADPRRRSEHVRLRVLLAELWDAEGRGDRAREVLDALDLSEVTPVDAAVIRHGRAVVRLRAGDYEDAKAVLDSDRTRTGVRELDLRLDLLRASVALELDAAEDALETATRVRRGAGGDPALTIEARVVRAAALDALGDRAEALEIVRSLGPEMITMLRRLGQPRVRELAAALEE